jgi:hypothetical protein
MYNVTLRRVLQIIFAVEKQYVLYTCLCVCAHVSACVHVRAWVGELPGVWACACAWVRVALLI